MAFVHVLLGTIRNEHPWHCGGCIVVGGEQLCLHAGSVRRPGGHREATEVQAREEEEEEESMVGCGTNHELLSYQGYTFTLHSFSW